ncbi:MULTISPECIES: citrate lyase subunit alpha [Pelosinus]|uniref:Citrate lyase alpha subunit n=1 Tax=Pelosinus fermentans B4 TaxID=1149862 RepID=I9L5T6_9FIRM|nr:MULTISPECIES: citrate lyase subunit alpha [Pelosinus]EIW15724.1 Citrate lyase alpha subunit [Pelosinus fermentans B4]EIW27570.1 Citrate lyase alpha subunit [Pelosinus fermentans A11]
MLNEAETEVAVQSLVDRPKAGAKLKTLHPDTPGKLLRSIEEAIDASGLKSGMKISFHHGLLNGDEIMNTVLKMIAYKGMKGLTLSAGSSLRTKDTLLHPFFLEGVIVAEQTSDLQNKLEHFFNANNIKRPISVGTQDDGVPSSKSGEAKVDVAFIAATSCDTYGNIRGLQGTAAGACLKDVTADTVVVITDSVADHPICLISTSQRQADYIVKIDYR